MRNSYPFFEEKKKDTSLLLEAMEILGIWITNEQERVGIDASSTSKDPRQWKIDRINGKLINSRGKID